MNKAVLRAFVGLLIGAVMLVAGCASMGKADEDAAAAAIQEIWKNYSKAATSGDAALWLSLWDESGIQLTPDMPARPKKVLNEAMPKAFAAMKIHTMNITAEEITVMGGYAYCRGAYTSDRTIAGQMVKIDGKFLTIFRRQADGSWKIYRDCFNSNLPPK